MHTLLHPNLRGKMSAYLIFCKKILHKFFLSQSPYAIKCCSLVVSSELSDCTFWGFVVRSKEPRTTAVQLLFAVCSYERSRTNARTRTSTQTFERVSMILYLYRRKIQQKSWHFTCSQKQLDFIPKQPTTRFYSFFVDVSYINSYMHCARNLR